MSLLHIVGGAVFDAIHGEVMRDGVVCVADDRITAVGQASAMTTSSRDVHVIDAAGQFVMPGMIDCHVHLLSSAAPDYASRGLQELLPYTAIRGAVHATRMLERGFTTVRDVGALGYGNIALRQAIEDGLVPGPRLYAAGHALSVPGGHSDNYYRPKVHVQREGFINGHEEARRAVRELIKMRAGGTTSGIPAYAVHKSHLVMERHQESVRRAHEMGVKIAMGTDCGTPFNVAGTNALELELLTQHGLSTAEALMATTRVAAEAIGIQDCTGTLAPGKWADIILVRGNPLDDIRVLQHTERITSVIKAGQIVKETAR